MDKYSYISNAHGHYLDDMYAEYKNNPESVDASWQKFFEGFEFGITKFGEGGVDDGSLSEKEIAVYLMIDTYRERAHLLSKTNPVRERLDRKPFLDIEDFGLSKADLDTEFQVGSHLGIGKAKLSKIVAVLKEIYSGPLGFEYMYIRDPEIQEWLKNRFETEGVNYNPPTDTKKRILEKLNEAVVFENFLHTKYIGQKRFSLEGGETLIPAMDRIIESAGASGAKEVIIGMAHRGRLNVLANTIGKTYEEIFNEFEGNTTQDLTMGDGDVKYHMGYSNIISTESGNEVYVKLAPNPSHLEAVDPVVLGMARAQIDDEYKGDQSSVIPIVMHGDAAVAGQGIVYETVQMSQLEGYHTGGTIHFVINNQVGFTTDFEDARSSIYCTDIAKIVDAPVIHVNGDAPEAVDFAVKIAVEYRQKFHKDIFIDMVCYRRHGHNESDEPKFTQPKLYSAISKHPNPREVYNSMLTSRGDIDAELAKSMDSHFRKILQERLDLVKQKPLPKKPQKIEEEWKSLKPSKSKDFDKSPKTAITKATIEKIGKALVTVPEGFKPLKQIERLFKDRNKNFFENKELSWADAELLAYASVLLDGNIVRMSGQDVKRGTFSHRHAVLFDANTNEQYCSINHIDENQDNKIKIYNSLLSEYGVLGFEYGFAMATPNALTIWEAQFGDFANGAQTMIDQFLSSAESKWQRQNGLVMLLPHGYEGQGPEHSNARPERFLQLAAEDNMIVANCTNAANFFHLLRRQVAWNFRKPCVVFSPKSGLRNPLMFSPIADFTKGGFSEIYTDKYADAKKVKKVLMCTGKVYFDLVKEQQESKREDVAIIRVEQLHPLPKKQIDAELKKYGNAKLYWVQEEPENMGAWTYMLRFYRKEFEDVISRKPSASPATGFAKVHAVEQADIVSRAFSTK